MTNAAHEFKDEPDWLVDQMLKRKRDEVLKRWEERESRLRQVRAREKSLEERGSKRRRVDDGHTRNTGHGSRDEDDEWMLADADDSDATAGDSSSNFSKETRELMKKLGMGGGTTQNEEEGDVFENDIKVSECIELPVFGIIATAI